LTFDEFIEANELLKKIGHTSLSGQHSQMRVPHTVKPRLYLDPQIPKGSPYGLSRPEVGHDVAAGPNDYSSCLRPVFLRRDPRHGIYYLLESLKKVGSCSEHLVRDVDFAT
jgi:hypothetical protein